MKKIVSVILVIFLFSSLIFCTGCSNGYQAVRRITFTTNGTKKLAVVINQMNSVVIQEKVRKKNIIKQF